MSEKKPTMYRCPLCQRHFEKLYRVLEWRMCEECGQKEIVKWNEMVKKG